MLLLVCMLTLKKSAALVLYVKNQRLQGTTKHPSNPTKNLQEDSKFGTLISQDHYQIPAAVVICLPALIGIHMNRSSRHT